MKGEKLNPCAYCNSPLELEWMSYEPYGKGGRWFVVCSNLYCPTNFNSENKNEVIEKWNMRLSCKTCKHSAPNNPNDGSIRCYKLYDVFADVFYCSKYESEIEKVI